MADAALGATAWLLDGMGIGGSCVNCANAGRLPSAHSMAILAQAAARAAPIPPLHQASAEGRGEGRMGAPHASIAKGDGALAVIDDGHQGSLCGFDLG